MFSLATLTVFDCFPFNNRYLRIRRLKQTYFIKCTSDDTIGYLKEQISLATKKEVKPDHMRIIQAKDHKPLDDDMEAISNHEELNNGAELHVVFQISDAEWEAVHVDDTEAGIAGEASTSELEQS
jgi:hypothetical protein